MDPRTELLLSQLDQLPTLPAVAVRVLEAAARDDSSADEVVTLIESDPALSANVLALVHRADLGVRGSVDSVRRAVSLLGFEALRCSVLALSVFKTLEENKSPAGHFDREGFWKHSLAVACCAELLVKQLPPALANQITPSGAFLSGLLHDMGKIALDTMLPKSFNRVVEGVDLLRGNIADLERNILGLDHLTVGKRLAEKWNLPAFIRETAWLHGQLPEALPESVSHRPLINLITLADLLVRELHLGYSGNYTLTDKAVWMSALSLKSPAVEDVLSRLVPHMQVRAAALQLGQSTTDSIYLSALSQANRELGRIGGDLASRNRRLLVRAKFFDALSGFHGELRPDAPPQSVLHAIGETAVEVLGVPAVGIFSLTPAARCALSVLINADGDLFETSLIDCPAAITAPPEGLGPVSAAGDDLDWLLSAISPRLASHGRFWIALVSDDQVIGGVVWGAPPGEAQRLSLQVRELAAMAGGWALALRTAQIREEAKTLAEQLADTNRRLQSAQNEIVLSQMMLTVGEMAAGAAHEMNNPLAVISGRSQLLVSQLTDPRQKHAANLIHEQSHRLSEIITELMDFAKPAPPQLQTIEVSDLIGRALHDAKMLTDPADRSIETTVTDVPPVRVDPIQVAAALTELIGNAMQATDAQAGVIEIHAALESGSGQVVITISDNGCGMDAHTLAKAFDPFFSAKPAGRRRGLGLAKALRWVKASGGSIQLQSQLNQGTRSVIPLPLPPEPVLQVEPVPTRQALRA